MVARGVGLSYRVPVLTGVGLTIAPGARVTVLGPNGSGTTTLMQILAGVVPPDFGSVELDGVDLREAEPVSLARAVSLAWDQNEIFEGTLEENILMGRDLPLHDLRWALEVTGLDQHLPALPAGLRTELVSQGRNLSRSAWHRVMLARAIADRPRVLLLDGALDGLDEGQRRLVLDRILDHSNPWTVVSTSSELEAVVRCDVLHLLEGGRLVESGPPRELASRESSALRRLFPELCRGLLRQEML